MTSERLSMLFCPCPFSPRLNSRTKTPLCYVECLRISSPSYSYRIESNRIRIAQVCVLKWIFKTNERTLRNQNKLWINTKTNMIDASYTHIHMYVCMDVCVSILCFMIVLLFFLRDEERTTWPLLCPDLDGFDPLLLDLYV